MNVAARASERSSLVELIQRCSPTRREIKSPILPPAFSALAGKTLPRKPGVVFFDVYGTLLSSAAGEHMELPPTVALADGDPEGANAMRILAESLAGLRTGANVRDFLLHTAEAISNARRRRASRQQDPEIDIVAIIEGVIPSAARPEAKRIALLRELAVNPCIAMPGAKTLLASLKLAGMRMGLISNAQFYTPLVIEALLGATPQGLGFDRKLTFYSYRCGSAKPGSLLYERAKAALSAIGIAAHDAAHVGNDERNDVRPASKLGFMTILFAGDKRSLRYSSTDSTSSTDGPDSVALDLDSILDSCGLGRPPDYPDISKNQDDSDPDQARAIAMRGQQ